MEKTKKANFFVSVSFIAIMIVVAVMFGTACSFFDKDEAEKYSLTYEINGKSYTITGDDYYALKNKLPQVPEKDGYVFGGYYLDESFATPLTETNFDEKVKAGETVKLTLRWYDAKNTSIQSGLLYGTGEDGAIKIIGLSDKTITNLVIPDVIVGTIPLPVTEIAENAFVGCENLQSVTLGVNISNIGENAFKGWKKAYNRCC